MKLLLRVLNLKSIQWAGARRLAEGVGGKQMNAMDMDKSPVVSFFYSPNDKL